MNTLRQTLRQARAKLDTQFQQEAALQIKAQLTQLLAHHTLSRIGVFLAQEGEADPLFFIQYAASLHKSLFVPVSCFEQNTLSFYPYQLGEPLVKNRYNIPEPITQDKTPVLAETLDVILVPLVAFDCKKNRMGRGAGFYDRTFAPLKTLEKKPLLIGIAYEMQKVDHLETHEFDIKMDYIVTEQKIYGDVDKQ